MEITLFLYGMLVIGWVLVTVTLVTALTLLSIFSKRTVALTWKLNKTAKHLRNDCINVLERWNLLILRKVTNSCTHIRVYYYPFIPIDEKFCRDTVRNLLGRIFDAILMFRK